MSSNPKVRALASEAALKIKALTVAHQTQIEAIYRDFREQTANLESNADELQTHSVTPIPSQANSLREP